MNKIRTRIQFIDSDSITHCKKYKNELPGSSPNLRIYSRQIQTRQTSRSSKVSPDQHKFSRKVSEIIIPISEITEKKKSTTKSTGKLPLNSKKNFTPMMSPNLHPKSTHRRVFSDYTSSIYKHKIINEIKNIEKESPQKKITKKIEKSTKRAEKNENLLGVRIPSPTEEIAEKQALIKYITKYFLQYNQSPTTSIDFYRVLGLIGKGAFGKVLLCEQKLTGKKVAIKALSKAQLQNTRSQKKVFQEVYILRKIKSKYVIKILEVFESEKNFLMVLEYAGGGDLLHYVREKGKLKEEEAKKIFKQIIQGAIAIHEAGILHRDFKLDNILLDSNYSIIKICDFGVSKIIREGELILDQCGTPAYLAPEIIKNEGYEGFYVDVWSLGIVLYTMVCGKIPFKATSVKELHKVILLGEFEIPDEISEYGKNLMKSMIIVEPTDRISLPEVLKHPWFSTKNYHEIDRTLPNFYPKILKENSSEEIKEHTVNLITEFGFSYDYVIKSLVANEMNHATAMYYLLI